MRTTPTESRCEAASPRAVSGQEAAGLAAPRAQRVVQPPVGDPGGQDGTEE
ncbi:hypothetical protein BKA00_001689 [Actinomadura coerulea]|uniref:Uncharacterized protein n=1 Tax=Actinomadura coerulea TaxID=46159 RepID=A0A7X0FW20_9ACTN|nr:hypothetical protein [Actinomadura coerulea]MBB6394775.1 hypothetical protein [Actinomadura coerulea]